MKVEIDIPDNIFEVFEKIASFSSNLSLNDILLKGAISEFDHIQKIISGCIKKYNGKMTFFINLKLRNLIEGDFYGKGF